MNFAVKSRKHNIFSLACTAALCAIAMGSANAQAFSAWNSNQAKLVSGYTFSINGVAQSDLSNVGQDGTYDFGFTNSHSPIVVQFLGGSTAFGVAPGGYMSFTSIDEFG